MQSKFWKVHINDIHSFIKLGANNIQIITWEDFCNRYNNYIYICENNSNNLKYGYMPFKKSSLNYFKSNNYIYMGDYNLKRVRKEKLKKINENRR
jgi:hypothetical protein